MTTPVRRAPVAGLVTMAAVVAVDQLTKTWVLRTIGPDESRHVVGPLHLVRRFNTGAAFSVASGHGALPWLVSALVVGLLVWIARTLLQPNTATITGVVLGTIGGGALGNQVDRLFRGEAWNHGAVVDFLDVRFWPVFNLADAALTCGCIALVVHLVVADRRTAKQSSVARS